MMRGSLSSQIVSQVSRQNPWSGNGGTGRPSFLWTCLGLDRSMERMGARQLRPMKTRYLSGRVSLPKQPRITGRATAHVFGRRPPLSFRLTFKARLIAPPMVVASWYRLCQSARSFPFLPGSE